MITTFDSFESSMNKFNVDIQKTIDLIKQLESSIIIQKQQPTNKKMSGEITVKKMNRDEIYYDKSKYYYCQNNSEYEVDPNGYIKVLISSNDLDLFNVKKGEVVFIRPITPADITKNIQQGSLCLYDIADKEYNMSIYKTWQVINLMTMCMSYKSVPNKIAQSTMFKPILKDIRYASNTYATKHYYDIKIQEFMDKNIYNVAIVTRLDNTGHWIFDIIPANQIIGYVKYAIPADKVDLLR